MIIDFEGEQKELGILMSFACCRRGVATSRVKAPPLARGRFGDFALRRTLLRSSCERAKGSGEDDSPNEAILVSSLRGDLENDSIVGC